MAVSEEECSSVKSGSPSSSSSYSPSSPPPRYYLSKCVLRGSAILQVLYANLRSPSSNDVVFGKETSIELVVIDEDGNVQTVCDQPVFGIIKDLAVLPWNEKFRARRPPQTQGKDLLVALSDSGKLSLLTFCNEMNRFFPITHVQLSDPGHMRNIPGRMLAIDSSGCFIAASAYEDRLALFSMSTSMIGNDIIDERIIYPSEGERTAIASRAMQKTSISGTIWSMCFISLDIRQPSNEHNPVLAIILNRNGAAQNELLLLEWNVKAHTVSVISQYVDTGPLAHNIVEVPNSLGLAFLFRAGDVLLMDFRDPHNPLCVYKTCLNILPFAMEEQTYMDDSCKLHDLDDEGFSVAACALLQLSDFDPMCIDSDSGNTNSGPKYICSWSWEPENLKVPRMIFCVDTGEFFMIEVFVDYDGPKFSLSECLYKGLPCKELLWVKGGYLASMVEMGDSVVLKLRDGRLSFTNLIQNISPIFDVAAGDYHDEKHEQMFACCGVTPEGSLRIIQSGINVEKLLRTPSTYEGVAGTWTVRMKITDSYHSFLVLSFLGETRILSVGLSFTDVTDNVGFQPNVCTLACGLVSDGLLVQIYQSTVKLCLPTKDGHSEGIPLSSPICTSWSPDNLNISLGAVGHNFIVVSTSNPCFLFILGVRVVSGYQHEIYEMQHLELQNELSCISIPRPMYGKKQSSSSISEINSSIASFVSGVDINKTFVIGTHRPSVEIWSFDPNGGVTVVACGTISLKSTMGTAKSFCIPQDVRLVFVDKYYVLAGLRNGMLLRFEWPTESSHSSSINVVDTALSSINLVNSMAMDFNVRNDLPCVLQLIAIRRIGITPVFLVPLDDTLDADIIALSDRAWLLHSARHSISYTSISFQPSSHVTPVCSIDCPKGILFVAENSLHLVEMVHSKRLSMRKFHLEGTPRKVLYHNESRMLLVMRTELSIGTCLSDICCVDPLSGSVVSSFRMKLGETATSMELIRFGSEQVLVVGTSLYSGPPVISSGEAENAKGRLLVLCLVHVQNSDSGSMTFCSKAGSSSQKTSPFNEIVGHVPEQLSSSSLASSPDDSSSDGIKLDENEMWQFRLACSTTWHGVVQAICPYLDRYFLASAGNTFYVCGFPNDTPQRVKRYAAGKTRFMIKSLTAYFRRIAVGDSRDGILFYSYHEEAKKLEQLYGDPSFRLVANCLLMDDNTAIVSDRKGSIAVLCSDHLEAPNNVRSECNLKISCAYFMAEIAVSIQKSSYSYRLPADDVLSGGIGFGPKTNVDPLQNTILACTLLGSIMIFIPISREEYELLEAVQARLVVHHLTAPVLGNDHDEFRSRENPDGVPKILDGDMLTQFLELTNMQQNSILSLEPPDDMLKPSSKPLLSQFSVNQVIQLLERVHYALN
ncbi:hypothetical protein RYX36_032067 [Vicia faba]